MQCNRCWPLIGHNNIICAQSQTSIRKRLSLRASSPIWVSEVSLARTRERGGRAPRGFAARSRVLARLASLAQIGELARRLKKTWNVKSIVSQRLSHPFWKTFAAVFPDPTNRLWVFEYSISTNLKLLWKA